MAAMAWSSVLLGCVLLGGDTSSAFMQSTLLARSTRDGTEFCSRAAGIAQDAARDSGRTRARAREGCLCMKGGGGGNKSKGNKKGRGKANPELEAALQDWEPVIGIEIHAQLSSSTKAYCSCSTLYSPDSPNTNVCPVCLGEPGSLPVPNARVVELSAKAGMALGCNIAAETKWDRKNYFYPDTPKNYQITQYDRPIAEHGEIVLPSGKKVGVTRLHMEEDSAKMNHQGSESLSGSTHSLIDFNRAGTPLAEIVSEPDMRAGVEAAEYGRELQRVLRYLGVSDGNMAEGSMRLDVNVSLRPKGETFLNTKVELKNLNSFRAVQESVDFEIVRQAKCYEADEVIRQETRLWDEKKKVTQIMRIKEGEADYRYFPEPDIPPLELPAELRQKWRSELCELPVTCDDVVTNPGYVCQNTGFVRDPGQNSVTCSVDSINCNDADCCVQGTVTCGSGSDPCSATHFLLTANQNTICTNDCDEAQCCGLRDTCSTFAAQCADDDLNIRDETKISNDDACAGASCDDNDCCMPRTATCGDSVFSCTGASTHFLATATLDLVCTSDCDNSQCCLPMVTSTCAAYPCSGVSMVPVAANSAADCTGGSDGTNCDDEECCEVTCLTHDYTCTNGGNRVDANMCTNSGGVNDASNCNNGACCTSPVTCVSETYACTTAGTSRAGANMCAAGAGGCLDQECCVADLVSTLTAARQKKTPRSRQHLTQYGTK